MSKTYVESGTELSVSRTVFLPREHAQCPGIHEQQEGR